uniref:Lin-37 DREAM MuvB core complex component n=1 Tax=Petromyzon marinus TaxID=7757 RepID=S4R9I9_PETMA
MSNVRVKVEKDLSDGEPSAARNKLDAVLQFLVEKNDQEREQEEGEHRLGQNEFNTKDTSPTGIKRSTRFPHQKRKRRKDMDDFISENSHPKQNTYVMKLFDRSVDLARFNETTPLYPICRAWMSNNPGHKDDGTGLTTITDSTENDNTGVTEFLNGECVEVLRLPPPTTNKYLQNLSREHIYSVQKPHNYIISQPEEMAPPNPILLYNHMERWKKIRQKWRVASHHNQMRYAESMKILKEMFDRQ